MASVVTSCVTISACSASTTVCTLYAGPCPFICLASGSLSTHCVVPSASQPAQSLRRLRLLASQHLERLAHGTGVDRGLAFLGVRGIEPLEVLRDPPIERRLLPQQPLAAQHRLAARHRLELRAIDRQPLAADQPLAAAEAHERRRHGAQRRALAAAELGDRLVIRGQPVEQPHQLDVALALALQTPRGPHLLQVAVQVQLQQVGRVVGRAARGRRLGLAEPQLHEVERSDEGIDDPADVVLRHQLIERYREQRPLVPTVTAHEAHNENARNLRCGHCLHRTPKPRVFLHRLAGPGFCFWGLGRPAMLPRSIMG